jgi:hypothetical protein
MPLFSARNDGIFTTVRSTTEFSIIRLVIL